MKNAVTQKQVCAVGALLALLSGYDARGEAALPDAAPAAAGLPEPKVMPATIPQSLRMKSPVRHDLAIGEKIYKNTCSICHRIGQRGAPRLGDMEGWSVRLAQGSETLYDRAINGYRGSKGSMPSRGSNASLSENEVKAAVDYMVWYSVPGSHGSFGSHLFSATPKKFTIR